MIAALVSLLTSRLAGPLASAAALLLGVGLLWQTARIDGVPLLGGGLKEEMAQLQAAQGADALARARALDAALAAQAQAANAANDQARAHALASRANDAQIRTVLKEVPVYVTQKSNAACTLGWGAVRLLDAAISGADPGYAEAHIGPGQPDDAPSGIKLSEAVSLLAADFAIARDNADQLTHLEGAVASQGRQK